VHRRAHLLHHRLFPEDRIIECHGYDCAGETLSFALWARV
jgi:hypothetical protein